MNKDVASAENVAIRVEFLRSFFGMKQNAFAEAIGATGAQYNNWKGGRQRMPLAQALKLQELYGVTLDFIYLGRANSLPADIAGAWSEFLRDETSKKSNDSPDIKAQ